MTPVSTTGPTPRERETMFNDARTLEPGVRLETDVCVVGSGAAGLAVAHALAGTGVSVLVLESGGRHGDAEGEDANTLPLGRARGPLLSKSNRYLAATRARRFGDLERAWRGACRPLDPEDFAVRDWVPRSGWPLGPTDLAAHFTRARELLGFTPADAPTPPGLLATDGRFDNSWLAYAPTALGQEWRRSTVAASNVDLWTHATVTALTLDDGGGRVETATVSGLEGPPFEVRARHFVLAVGALGNARLLLASNTQRAAGLGNAHDLVGRFFMDQLILRAGYVILPGSADVMAHYTEPTEPTEPAEGPGRQAVIRPLYAFQARHELLNSLTMFEPATTEEGGALAAAVGRSVAGVSRLAGQAQPSRADLSNGYFGSVTLRGEQLPNRDSRLTLRPERDALGVPQIDLSWQLSDHDSWSLRTTARLLGESLGRRGLGRLQLRVGPQLRRRYFGWSGHQSGTTRMSEQPSTGVVNPDCKVHDLPNLFVAGGSVFPTSGCSGPLLTTLALALRLGEHLQQVLDE